MKSKRLDNPSTLNRISTERSPAYKEWLLNLIEYRTKVDTLDNFYKSIKSSLLTSTAKKPGVKLAETKVQILPDRQLAFQKPQASYNMPQESKKALDSPHSYSSLPQISDFSQLTPEICHGATSPVSSICMSDDGKWIVSGSRDGTVSKLSVKSKTHVARLIGHTDGVSSVCISKDGRWIISASLDGSIRIWHICRGTQYAVLRGHTAMVHSICMSSDGSWISSVSYDKTVRIWNLNTMAQKAVLIGHEGYIYALCISSDGKWIISGGYDHSIILWNVKKNSREATLLGHTHIITSLCISRDGRWIISGSADSTIRIWNMQTKLQMLY